MSRAKSNFLCAMAAALMVCLGVSPSRAQQAQPDQPAAQAPKPDAAAADKAAGDKKAQDQQQQNPFAPEPAPPLPAGMSGSDANDPRAKLTPGLFDAGETAMGLKHLQLIKKAGAFDLGATDPEDPKVMKALATLGVGNASKMPAAMRLPIAGLAFANSDLAFQGDHLFQGNFYGMTIYDISNPANAKPLTTMVCPGGQGDVSVYKNLMFMSVEMTNGRLDCGTQGFAPNPEPTDAEKAEDKAAAERRT